MKLEIGEGQMFLSIWEATRIFRAKKKKKKIRWTVNPRVCDFLDWFIEIGNLSVFTLLVYLCGRMAFFEVWGNVFLYFFGSLNSE